MPHLHYHCCEICEYTVTLRMSGEKGLKMCPCRDAYYCGSEHQKLHWPYHKYTCYARNRKEPLSPTDIAIQHLLQFHDTSIVELAISSLLKEDIDFNFRDLEEKAVVITVEQREGEEDMDVAVAAGKMPPYQISRKFSVVSVEEEARARGFEHPFLENPLTREMRLMQKEIDGNHVAVTMIFQPGGRAVTKRVPVGQLAIWETLRESEKKSTNPPKLYWNLAITNGVIGQEIMEERERKDASRS